MVSNLKSARQAIEAELTHAKQGVAFYTARMEALEVALHQLENVEGDGGDVTEDIKRRAKTKIRNAGVSRRGRRARAAADTNGAEQSSSVNTPSRQRLKVTKGSQKRRTAPSSRRSDGLPTTGGEFWLNLVSDQPQSAVDIANAAIAALGIRPDQTEQIQKMKQRVSPALAGLVSAQKIKDSGAGRERRFFRQNHQPA